MRRDRQESSGKSVLFHLRTVDVVEADTTRRSGANRKTLFAMILICECVVQSWEAQVRRVDPRLVCGTETLRSGAPSSARFHRLAGAYEWVLTETQTHSESAPSALDNDGRASRVVEARPNVFPAKMSLASEHGLYHKTVRRVDDGGRGRRRTTRPNTMILLHFGLALRDEPFHRTKLVP